MIYKNRNFTKRDYEATNIVACIADNAPNENYIEADETILNNLTPLYRENGAQYWGYL